MEHFHQNPVFIDSRFQSLEQKLSPGKGARRRNRYNAGTSCQTALSSQAEPEKQTGEFREGAYGIYALDEKGQPQWGMGTSGQSDINLTVPYQFCRLTHEIIEEDLSGVDYEDYIITQSTQLYTVIVWARCPGGEDRFVTYPARPEFVGVENRRLYTLEEMQAILRNAYWDDQ